TISGSVVNGGVKAVDVRTGSVSGNVTWAETGLPYRINCGSVNVQSGVTLTIAPNIVVKFQNASSGCPSYLSISGSLVANGTSSQPVYFTSLVDDAVGGDTNGDGNATTPAAGLWGGIIFQSGSGGSISNAVVRYAGSSSLGLGAVYIGTNNASPTLSN